MYDYITTTSNLEDGSTISVNGVDEWTVVGDVGANSNGITYKLAKKSLI